MASVSDISSSVAAGSTGTTKNVTVSGTLSFDAGEVDKPDRLEIQLFGGDEQGDTLPSTDAVGDDVYAGVTLSSVPGPAGPPTVVVGPGV